MDVVKIKFGSHLYGTTTPSSDMDFKSVFIPTREEIHEALELLYTGNVTLPLKAEIRNLCLKVKLGQLPYQEVADVIEELLERVEQAAVDSDLREVPDYEFADELVLQIHDAVVRGVTLV